MTNYISNPPWADRILNKYWDKLERYFGKENMPAEMTPNDKYRQFREYGCGFYGCVYPTQRQGKVFKLTTDKSEAAFVCAALKIHKTKRWPKGIARFYNMVEIPDGVVKKIGAKSRAVFALLREEAFKIGELKDLDSVCTSIADAKKPDARITKLVKSDMAVALGSTKTIYDCAHSFTSLNLFKTCCEHVKNTLDISRNRELLLKAFKNVKIHAVDPITISKLSKIDSMLRSKIADYEKEHKFNEILADIQHRNNWPRRLLAYVTALKTILSFLSGAHSIIPEIGKALKQYMILGLLLGDVHNENIAFRLDATRIAPIITDPGVMIPLDKKWLSVEVPVLE